MEAHVGRTRAVLIDLNLVLAVFTAGLAAHG